MPALSKLFAAARYSALSLAVIASFLVAWLGCRATIAEEPTAPQESKGPRQTLRERIAAGDYEGALQSALSSSDSQGRLDMLLELRGGGGLGGGAQADFDSLMELIQSTIAPDSWEQLGGPGTMEPYFAGVFVDSEGMVSDLESIPTDDELTALRRTTLARQVDAGTARHWSRNSPQRKISLRQLEQRLARSFARGEKVDDELLHLAGLYRIDTVVLDPAQRDVILIGPAGGLRRDELGRWLSDDGRTAFRLDDFGYVVRGSRLGETLGCTIEPDDEHLRDAFAWASSQRSLSDQTARELAGRLGNSRVQLFGLSPASETALLVVEADRHMKRVALGDVPGVAGIPTYLQLIANTPELGAPQGQLLRLWFAPRPPEVTSSEDRLAFAIRGETLQVVAERETVADKAQRRAVGGDPRARMLADAFNEHFDRLAVEYPVYARLRTLYEVATLSRILELAWPVDAPPLDWGLLAEPDLWASQHAVAPQTVRSIAVHERHAMNGKRLDLVAASGGVSLRADVLLPQLPEPNAGAAASRIREIQSTVDASRPVVRAHWWWD
jgi:hypothetical protein